MPAAPTGKDYFGFCSTPYSALQKSAPMPAAPTHAARPYLHGLVQKRDIQVLGDEAGANALQGNSAQAQAQERKGVLKRWAQHLCERQARPLPSHEPDSTQRLAALLGRACCRGRRRAPRCSGQAGAGRGRAGAPPPPCTAHRQVNQLPAHAASSWLLALSKTKRPTEVPSPLQRHRTSLQSFWCAPGSCGGQERRR